MRVCCLSFLPTLVTLSERSESKGKAVAFAFPYHLFPNPKHRI